MTASNNEIFEAIGGLKAEVVSLRRDLQESQRTAVEATHRADDHRTAIHASIEEGVKATGTIEARLDAVEKTVKEVKEVTDQVRVWRQMGMGALGVTGIAAGAIASLVTAYWHDILRMIRGQ